MPRTEPWYPIEGSYPTDAEVAEHKYIDYEAMFDAGWRPD